MHELLSAVAEVPALVERAREQTKTKGRPRY
jgi:hypothetical protein